MFDYYYEIIKVFIFFSTLKLNIAKEMKRNKNNQTLKLLKKSN